MIISKYAEKTCDKVQYQFMLKLSKLRLQRAPLTLIKSIYNLSQQQLLPPISYIIVKVWKVSRATQCYTRCGKKNINAEKKILKKKKEGCYGQSTGEGHSSTNVARKIGYPCAKE